MIELRGVVASVGQAPLSARVRVGEVVRLEGDAAAATALLEVLSGRRTAQAGEVVWREPAARGVLVRAGEALPPAVDGAAAARLWSTFAGGEPTRRAVRDPGDRGRGVPAVWLVDGPLGPARAGWRGAIEDEVRGGRGALVTTEPGGQVDRAIALVAGEPAPGAPPPPAVAGLARRRVARALAGFAGEVAGGRTTAALAAVMALALALAAAVVATHEGFWFEDGSRRGLAWVARLAATGAALVLPLVAATRAAVGRAWPAMLRETRAPRSAIALALVTGDVAAVAPAAAVAAWPTVWAGRGGHAAVVMLALVLGAALAATVARRGRGLVAVAALVGAAVALAAMW